MASPATPRRLRSKRDPGRFPDESLRMADAGVQPRGSDVGGLPMHVCKSEAETDVTPCAETFLSERAVRYHLQFMDTKELTRFVGRRDGRIITAKGIEELRNARVHVELHLYAEGRHAFGLRRTKFPITEWPALVEKWLGTIGVISE